MYSVMMKLKALWYLRKAEYARNKKTSTPRFHLHEVLGAGKFRDKKSSADYQGPNKKIKCLSNGYNFSLTE